MHFARHIFVFAIIASSSPLAHADWPQWGGPDRDFKVTNKGLARSWPKDGPPKLWSHDLGDGYGGVVEDGGTLYVMHRKKAKDDDKGHGSDVVVALDAKTGKA